MKCGVGWKLFEKLPKKRGRVPFEVFVATELHPDTILLHFLTQQQYENWKLSSFTKSLKKGLGLNKKIVKKVKAG